MYKLLLLSIFILCVEVLAEPNLEELVKTRGVPLDYIKETGAAETLTFKNDPQAALDLLAKIRPPKTRAEKALLSATRGRAYLKIGQIDKAEIDFRSATEFDWMVRAALADALHKSGKHEEAYGELSKYLEDFQKFFNLSAMREESCRLENKLHRSPQEEQILENTKTFISKLEKELSPQAK